MGLMELIFLIVLPIAAVPSIVFAIVALVSVKKTRLAEMPGSGREPWRKRRAGLRKTLIGSFLYLIGLSTCYYYESLGGASSPDYNTAMDLLGGATLFVGLITWIVGIVQAGRNAGSVAEEEEPTP